MLLYSSEYGSSVALNFLISLSGVGKSSLVHLILEGSAIARPAQTVGCAVGIKVGVLALCFPSLYHLHLFNPLTLSLLLFQHVTCGSAGGSSNNISNDAERNFFVELWDVSGHDRYKACRSIFYTQINGK